MKPGGGKQKGTAFERSVCKSLSLWVSHGADPDLFWRSAISGGRATVLFNKQGRSIKPAGDICSVDPGGHRLTDRYFIECKHNHTLELHRFVVHEGKLWGFWERCVEQALAHRRSPMLIAKQDRFPTLMMLLAGRLRLPYPLAEMGPCAVYRFDAVMLTDCKL